MLFCFVFLNNRWLYIVNRIYTVCFRSVYAIIICRLIIAFLAVVTASSTFAFAAAFFVCRIRRLIDFFSSSCIFYCCFASSFLTTVGWILLIVSTPFVFAVSTPALFVGLLTLSHYLRPHRFSLLLLFFVCRVWCLVDFRFLSFRRFINRCFASSFLTTVGCTLLIASTPFVFAVSTPLLLSPDLLTLSHYLRPHRLSLLLLPSLHLSHQVFDRSAFLASAALSIAVLLRLS